MSEYNDRLADYVDVAKRITLFRDKHPEGSLRAEVVRYPENGFAFYIVRAEAIRFPGDTAPGVGWAAEPFPGRTPYTKDSELMVCETSAWGRAIVAALAADTKKGIASAEEIRSKAPPRRSHDEAGAAGSVSSGTVGTRSQPANPSVPSESTGEKTRLGDEGAGSAGPQAPARGAADGEQGAGVDREVAASAPSLAELKKLAGNQARAISLLYEATGVKFNALSILDATPDQLQAAMDLGAKT